MDWIYPQFEEVSFTGCTETRKVVNMTPHGANMTIISPKWRHLRFQLLSFFGNNDNHSTFFYDVRVKLFQRRGVSNHRLYTCLFNNLTAKSMMRITWPFGVEKSTRDGLIPFTGNTPLMRTDRILYVRTNWSNVSACSKSTDLIFHPDDIRSKSSGWLSR